MSEESATLQYITVIAGGTDTASFNKTDEGRKLLGKVPAQDRLIIGARAGDPDMVTGALDDGAEVNKRGNRDAGEGFLPLFHAIKNAKVTGSGTTAIDPLTGTDVDRTKDTERRKEVIQILISKGASTGIEGYSASEWFEYEYADKARRNPESQVLYDTIKDAIIEAETARATEILRSAGISGTEETTDVAHSSTQKAPAQARSNDDINQL